MYIALYLNKYVYIYVYKRFIKNLQLKFFNYSGKTKELWKGKRAVEEERKEFLSP